MGCLGERITSHPHSVSIVQSALFRHALRPARLLPIIILSSITFAQINHIEVAARLLSQGQLAQAETEARKALGSPGTRALALAMLGTIRLQESKYDESIGFLTQALTLDPRLPGARTSLGSAYLLQDKLDLARKSFREVLRIDSGNVNARLSLAKVEASLHNFQQSLDVAGPIVPQLRGTEEGLLLLATDYGALGRKEKLRGLVGDWKGMSAASPEASLDFGDLLATYGMTAEAREIFETQESKIADQRSSTLAYRLGRSYLALGALDRAETNLQLALTLDPQCVVCLQGLAEVAEKEGNTEKALAHLIAAKKMDPENPGVLFEFGKVCLQRNLLDDAMPALTKAAALKPDQESYIYVLGSAYVAKHDLVKAASLFGELLQRHPHDAVLNYSMGAVYYLRGKYPDAEAALKESLRLQPEQVAAAYYLGLTYSSDGQDDQAATTFRDLLKRYPEHSPSYVKLGGILLRQHQYDEAKQDLERAVALDPNSVEAHYQMGLLLRRLGNTAESDQELAQSRKLEEEHRAQTDMHLRLLLPE
jgi:tetratricopeptide (TPR) repeat protein